MMKAIMSGRTGEVIDPAKTTLSGAERNRQWKSQRFSFRAWCLRGRISRRAYLVSSR
jgi:hypothetical protein